jgi:hypothetical protein
LRFFLIPPKNKIIFRFVFECQYLSLTPNLVRHRPAHCLANGSFTPGGSSAGNGEPPYLPLGGDFGGRTPLGRSSPSNSIMSETLL